MKAKYLSILMLLVLAVGCSNLVDYEGGFEDGLEAKGMRKSQVPAYIEGEIGPGSLYAISVPAGWNGDLVLYAHGYVDPAYSVGLAGLPGVDLVVDGLNAIGYAVAFSSYSENGWALKDGVTRTKQLIGIFRSYFGKPGKTYLIGHSLGGGVTLMLAEKHPELIDGALSICSFVGGAKSQLEHVLHVRVLFDVFYPGLLPGSPVNIPEGINFGVDIYPLVESAMSLNPLPAGMLAAVDQAGILYGNELELGEAILGALYFNFVGTMDMLSRTHDHIMVGNMDTVYTVGGGTPDPLLNAAVQRFESTPDAENYVNHWYQPSGKLKVPLMTLHTTRDPQVPYFHEGLYRQLVMDNGALDMLVQRGFNRGGHCTTITPEEHLASFLDLVTWAAGGLKPAEWVLPE